MAKYIVICSLMLLLVGCTQNNIKQVDLIKLDSVDVVIISAQEKPKIRAFMPRTGPELGAVPAAMNIMFENSLADAADREAIKFSNEFNAYNINENIARSIRSALEHVSTTKINSIEMVYKLDIGKKEKIISDRKHQLLLIDINHYFLASQNVFETNVAMMFFSLNDKDPVYTIFARTQSDLLGPPILKVGSTYETIPKTQEKINQEAVAINARYDEDIRKNPADSKKLNASRDREIKLSETVKTMLKRTPGALEGFFADTESRKKFGDALEEQYKYASELTLAVFEEAFSRNTNDHEKIMMPYISFQMDRTEKKEGYILKKFSQQSHFVFRSTPTGMQAPLVAIPNELISVPKANGGVVKYSQFQ